MSEVILTEKKELFKNIKLLGIIFIFLSILIYSNNVYGADLEKTVTDAYELYSVGNYEESGPMFEEAYLMSKKNSPKDISARFRTALYAGLSYRGTEDYEKSEYWFLVALALGEKVPDLFDIPTLLTYAAESCRLNGNGELAIKYYEKALTYNNLTNKDKAVLRYGLAESLRITKDLEGAKNNCKIAQKLAKPNKLYKIELSCDIVLGEYYRTIGDYSKAMFYFSKGADRSRAMKYNDILVPLINGMALTSKALKRDDAAREYFENALIVSIENGNLDNLEAISSEILNNIPDRASLKYQGNKFLELSKLEFVDDESRLILYKLSSKYYASSRDFVDLYVVSELGFELSEKLNNPKETVFFNYSLALGALGNKEYNNSFDKVEETFSRIKNGHKSYLDDKRFMSNLYSILAEYYYYKKEYNLSLNSLKKAIEYNGDKNSNMVYRNLNDRKENLEKILFDKEDKEVSED